MIKHAFSSWVIFNFVFEACNLWHISDVNFDHKHMEFIDIHNFITEKSIVVFYVFVKPTKFSRKKIRNECSNRFSGKKRGKSDPYVSPSVKIQVLWYWLKNGERHTLKSKEWR